MGCIYIDKQLSVEFLSTTNNDDTKTKTLSHTALHISTHHLSHELLFTESPLQVRVSVQYRGTGHEC